MLKNRKIGLLAIIGPALALGSIAVCIIVSPWFRWEINAISDFGVSDVAWLFNISLIICGILCLTFCIGLFMSLDNWLGKIGSIFLLLSCVSLVGIGLFTEDYSPWHFYFSVGFFVLLLLALLIQGTYFAWKGPLYIGILAMPIAFIGIYGWATYTPPGIAIPEAMTFVPGGLWFMLLGEWFFRST